MSAEDEIMSRRDGQEAMLPFYLNGTLSGEDLRAVEAWLEGDADAAAALAEAELEFSETGAANEAIRPPADALSRFSAALEREAGPTRAKAGQSRLASLWRGFMRLPTGLAWAAAAAAIALVLLQAGSGSVLDRGEYDVAGSEDNLSNGPFALVMFRPDAGMADVSAFLSGNGAAIIGGPTAGGVFRVAIPAGTAADYDRILGLIGAQPFTQNVTPGRKPAK
jgi:anti-sigma-K factor RskA